MRFQAKRDNMLFCFRHWWSRRRAFLRSFRHLRMLSCRKTIMTVGKVATGKCGVVHDVKKMQLIVLITCEIAFLLACQRLGFWIRHTWCGLLGPGWFCQITRSRATRVVRDTCLIVGLLPLMIIFITASLSSKMYKCDSFSERCVRRNLIFLISVDVLDFLSCTKFPWASLPCLGELFVERSISITMSQRSSAGQPSIRKPASSDMISDSVELWDTDVCFLHIQLIGTNVRLPKMHKTPLDVDFESSRSPAKSESWNNPNRQCWAALPTWQDWR